MIFFIILLFFESVTCVCWHLHHLWLLQGNFWKDEKDKTVGFIYICIYADADKGEMMIEFISVYANADKGKMMVEFEV